MSLHICADELEWLLTMGTNGHVQCCVAQQVLYYVLTRVHRPAGHVIIHCSLTCYDPGGVQPTVCEVRSTPGEHSVHSLSHREGCCTVAAITDV